MHPARKSLWLGAWLIAAIGACAGEKDASELELGDVVSHNILNTFGVQVRKLPDRYYEPALSSFVSEFMADAEARGVVISQELRDQIRVVRYADKLTTGAGAGVIAACSRYYVSSPTILGEMRKTRWLVIEVLAKESRDFTAGSRVRLRELMYHELFHCLLNKGHLPEGVLGIMSAEFTKGSDRAFTDWDGLVDEMFSEEFMDMIPDAQ